MINFRYGCRSGPSCGAPCSHCEPKAKQPRATAQAPALDFFVAFAPRKDGVGAVAVYSVTRPYRPAVPSISSFTHSPSSTRHTRLSRNVSQVRSNSTSSMPT